MEPFFLVLKLTHSCIILLVPKKIIFGRQDITHRLCETWKFVQLCHPLVSENVLQPRGNIESKRNEAHAEVQKLLFVDGFLEADC